MLIEDEELILEGLCSIIDWDSLGMKVVHKANNGVQALELWEKEAVDIIITDINMPIMNGLNFCKELRKKEERARCIILTGYDDFEYARTAIPLGIEEYILKPIDDELLEKVLKKADDSLEEYDRRHSQSLDENIGWIQFLKGKLPEEETKKYLSLLPALKPEGKVWIAIMKLDLNTLKTAKISDILVELKENITHIRVIYLSTDSLLLLYYENEEDEGVQDSMTELQNQTESTYGILSFLSISEPISDYNQIQNAYSEALQLQKYQVIEGYGGCMSKEILKQRLEGTNSQSLLSESLDEGALGKLILKKDTEEAKAYVENLFLNYVQKDTCIDELYKVCVKIALLLQDIKEEYQLQNKGEIQNLTTLIDRIFKAEDLVTIKAVFLNEIDEIIHHLHEENSQYTPVVKQIMAEVMKNYKEDMNLKTLAHKYHMNASYLGQIFQKETGNSFAQYLSNTKNSIAKDLILNTNMKIHEIAEAAGYPDISYFYRKFKQCYGVSPATLREMKKY